MSVKYKTKTGKRALFYNTNWATYTRNYQPVDIPEEVTDIIHAFWGVDENGNIKSPDTYADLEKRFTKPNDGKDPSRGFAPLDNWNENLPYYGIFGQYKKMLDSGRPVNISLSIGGWTLSGKFSPAISTAAKRTNFINQIIDTFKKYTFFSGIDFDWEYLSNDGMNYGNEGNIATKEDEANFVIFLKDLRNAFNNNNMSTYTISMCCIAAPEKIKFNVPLITSLLDTLHVMTYDFHDGSWGEKITAFQTNPRKSSFGKYSAEEAADEYIRLGAPPGKIYIGANCNSRGFNNTDGPGKPASGGSPDMSFEKGIVDYKDLPRPGATEYNDPESKAAYSFDPVKRIVNTYDNPISVIEKCKIINEKKLGGIIIWELSGDYPVTNPKSIVKTLYDNLTGGPASGGVKAQPQPQAQQTTTTITFAPTTSAPYIPPPPTTTSAPYIPPPPAIVPQLPTTSAPYIPPPPPPIIVPQPPAIVPQPQPPAIVVPQPPAIVVPQPPAIVVPQPQPQPQILSAFAQPAAVITTTTLSPTAQQTYDFFKENQLYIIIVAVVLLLCSIVVSLVLVAKK
jgi:chitinase